MEDVDFDAFLEDADDMELDSGNHDDGIFLGAESTASTPNFSAAWARPPLTKIVPDEDDLGKLSLVFAIALCP